MTDDIESLLTMVAFAVAVTAHVAILAGLALRPARWRSLAAAVVFPLAPLWAFREHMRARASIWVGATAAYVVMRFVDLR